MRRAVSLVLAVLVLAGCGGGDSVARSQAAKTAGAVTGDDQAKRATSPVCKLFSQTEIAKYTGEPVSAPEDVALGCQWKAVDGSGDVIVSIVPAKNHEPPRRSKGYKVLAEAGRDGFLAPYLDGWIVGAIVGEDALRASVAGAGASELTAVALLNDAIARHAAAAR